MKVPLAQKKEKKLRLPDFTAPCRNKEKTGSKSCAEAGIALQSHLHNEI
jgi:hypothetical protein